MRVDREAMAHECSEYVLRRSWRARRAPRESRRLCGLAVIHLTMLPYEAQMGPADELRKHLRYQLTEDAKAGNPKFTAIILQILISIIVKLIIEWWMRRREAKAWP